jgi:hypothetical protein
MYMCWGPKSAAIPCNFWRGARAKQSACAMRSKAIAQAHWFPDRIHPPFTRAADGLPTQDTFPVLREVIARHQATDHTAAEALRSAGQPGRRCRMPRTGAGRSGCSATRRPAIGARTRRRSRRVWRSGWTRDMPDVPIESRPPRPWRHGSRTARPGRERTGSDRHRERLRKRSPSTPHPPRL